MGSRNKQFIVAVLALSAALVGGWAQFAPHEFYTSFPLPGHHWVSPLGPYDEHLVRDVGGMYLGLLVISLWALVRPHGETFALVGSGWLAFSIPHLVYHLGHLDMFGTTDVVGNVVGLAGTVVLAALLLVPSGIRGVRPSAAASGETI